MPAAVRREAESAAKAAEVGHASTGSAPEKLGPLTRGEGMGSPIPGLRGMWPYHGGGLFGIPSLVVIRLDLAASGSAFGPAVNHDIDPARWKARLEGLPADRDAEEGKLSLQIGPSDVVTLQAVGRLPEGFSIDEAAMQAARAFAGDTLSGFADEVAAADHAASPAARLAAFPSPEAPAGPVTDAAGHARPVLADAPGFAVLLGGWGEDLSPDGEWHSLDLEDFLAEGRESDSGLAPRWRGLCRGDADGGSRTRPVGPRPPPASWSRSSPT